MIPSSIFKAISIVSSDMSLTLASLPSSFKDPGDDIEPIWIIQSNLLSRSLIQSHLQSPFFFFLQYKVACGETLFCLPQSFTVYSSHSGQHVNCSEPPRYFSVNFLLTVPGAAWYQQACACMLASFKGSLSFFQPCVNATGFQTS